MKPSKRLQEIHNDLVEKYRYNLDEDLRWVAIKDYLDEEYEKTKDTVVLTCKAGMENEYEAIKNEIKREAIKDFVEKLRKEYRNRGFSEVVLGDVLREFSIK